METHNQTKLRNFVFTLNNWTQPEVDVLLQIPYRYLLYGREVSESGTPHLQGYVELERRTSFNKVKEFLPRAYIAPRRGTQAEAISYCKKSGDFTEFGEPRIQGQRSDLKKIMETIQDGGNLRSVLELEEVNISVSVIRTAEKFMQYYELGRNYKPSVVWLHGPTGTGKTRASVKALPDAYFYSNSTGKWWSGYDAHEDVIIDDIRPTTISFMTLIGLLDRYSFQIEDKGSIRQFRGRRIIITAPEIPEKMYNIGYIAEDMKQLTRRIDSIVYFKEQNSNERYQTFDDLLKAGTEGGG